MHAIAELDRDIATAQRQQQVQDAASAALDAALGLAQEIQDRQTDVALARSELTTAINQGLSAEAAQRDVLAAQLRGSYTGNDVNQVTSGLLYQ